MGLNPRGRGGRGGKGSFPGKNRRGGGMGIHGPMFRPGPPGMFGPPQMGFPPEPPFGGPFFGGPSGYNYGNRAGFGKFPRRNFKKKVPLKNETPVPEIDLTKPWVTEEIKSEDAKKVELLEVWRKSKDDGDWSKYKNQKQIVQTLFDKAREQYIESHPEQAVLWQNITNVRDYFCETCDKSFNSDDDLLLHESKHEICGREGCEFTAHPKIIAKHIKMQHESGLYRRIAKVQAKEDIEKWIEERKRRYPSRRVIEEKKRLEEERKNRGERLKEDNSIFNKSFQKRGHLPKALKNKSQKRRLKRRKKIYFPQKYVLPDFQLEEARAGVPAFKGIKSENEAELTSNIKEEILNISDDEWNTFDNCQNFTKPLINNSLGLLAANYDSDIDILKEEEIKKEIVSDGEESYPEEVKTVKVTGPFKEEVPENNERIKRRIHRKRPAEQTKKRCNINKNVAKRQLTLLEKLLRKEIMHERNIILQCVHYIVQNNFFET